MLVVEMPAGVRLDAFTISSGLGSLRGHRGEGRMCLRGRCRRWRCWSGRPMYHLVHNVLSGSPSFTGSPFVLSTDSPYPNAYYRSVEQKKRALGHLCIIIEGTRASTTGR